MRRVWRSIGTIACVSGMLLIGAPIGAADPSDGGSSYVFRDFDVTGAASTQVNGINDRGAFDGAYTDAQGGQHGFVGDGRRIVRFDYPGTEGVTQGYGIDNSGDLVGVYTDAAGVYHGFLRTHDGTFRPLADAPGGGTSAGQGTFPTGLTDHEIVGFYIDSAGTYHGFRESLTGGFSVIDVAGSGSGPGQGTLIYAVNPAGELSGAYVTPDNREFGLVDRDGQVTDYNDPETPQSPAGGTDVIGKCTCGAATGDFVDTNGSTRAYVDLSGRYVTVTAPGSNDAPQQGTVAAASNDHLALVGFYYTTTGAEHGFIATPRRPPPAGVSSRG